MTRYISFFMLLISATACGNKKKIQGYKNLDHIKARSGAVNLKKADAIEEFGEPSFELNSKFYYVSISGNDSSTRSFVPKFIEVCGVGEVVGCDKKAILSKKA